jgi:hypothetical protein
MKRSTMLSAITSLTIVLCIGLLISGCGASTTSYQNTASGISFKRPASWTLDKENNKNMVVGFIGKDGTVFTVHINNKPGTSPLQAAASWKNLLTSDLLAKDKITNIQESNTTVGGVPAFKFEYDSVNSTTHVQKHNVDYVVMKGDKQTTIQYSRSSTDPSKGSTDLQQLIDSFKYL